MICCIKNSLYILTSFSFSAEEQIVLLHNSDGNSVGFDRYGLPGGQVIIPQATPSSQPYTEFNYHYHPLLHSASTDYEREAIIIAPKVTVSTSEHSALPLFSTTSTATSPEHVDKQKPVDIPKVEKLPDIKPSITLIPVDSVRSKRARYGRSKTTNTILQPCQIDPNKPNHNSNPCSIHLVDETQKSSNSTSPSCSGYVQQFAVSDVLQTTCQNANNSAYKNEDHLIAPLVSYDQANDPRKRLLIRKQVSEDVYKRNRPPKHQKLLYNSSIGINRYSGGRNRSLRSSQECSSESAVPPPFEFGR